MTRDTQKILWAVGLTAVAGAIIGGVIYASSKKDAKSEAADGGSGAKPSPQPQPQPPPQIAGGGTYALMPSALAPDAKSGWGHVGSDVPGGLW